MKKTLLIILFCLLVPGCFSGTLTQLGQDKVEVYYDEKLDRVEKGFRNPWAYPVILVLLPVAWSLDVLAIPYYLYEWVGKKSVFELETQKSIN